MPPSPPLFPFPVKNVCMCDKAVCFSATLLLCRQQLTCLPLFFFFFLPLSLSVAFLCFCLEEEEGRKRDIPTFHFGTPYFLLPFSATASFFPVLLFAFSSFFSRSDNTAISGWGTAQRCSHCAQWSTPTEEAAAKGKQQPGEDESGLRAPAQHRPFPLAATAAQLRCEKQRHTGASNTTVQQATHDSVGMMHAVPSLPCLF